MHLFEVILFDLFLILASPNRVLHADALDALYEYFRKIRQ